jgi:hypothetical protein
MRLNSTAGPVDQMMKRSNLT